jgi:squalene synthase HpnC
MTAAIDIAPTKTHRDENFPVASALIQKRHRDAILAFYRFARAADDVADHPTLSEDEKLQRLNAMEDTLLGRNEAGVPEGVSLKRALDKRGLSPRHAQDLLTAFRMDVTKRRYKDWDELIHYCSFSAMPVGRFVLDVHGESRSTWPASDALCAALQIINHLQDCGADFKNLDRVYIPLDALQRDGLTVEALTADRASPQLQHCLHELAGRTSLLLDDAKALSPQVQDWRLALEIAAIQTLASRLTRLLQTRDPLSQRVHLSPVQMAATSAVGMLGALGRRIAGRFSADTTARNTQ